MSGGRTDWFPQTTLNEVADKNPEWGTETEYGQRTVTQRGRVWQKARRQRQTQVALFNGEQWGLGLLKAALQAEEACSWARKEAWRCPCSLPSS